MRRPRHRHPRSADLWRCIDAYPVGSWPWETLPAGQPHERLWSCRRGSATARPPGNRR
ncbi:hypothetical protein [Actinoplanes sp. NPDC026670]|uniref:hypothetical protein n=1 Tax=Actinoplanes sp. NPDC026670 TaxID=3154700 RepID=UPI0033C1E996